MLKIAWSEIYVHPLPEGHRFPMEKYQLIYDQLLYEDSIVQEQIFTPGTIDEDVLLLTHTQDYWDKLRNLKLSPAEVRRTGFPLSDTLIQRERIIAEGTRQAASYALEHKIAMNIAGGTHHAFSDRGEGFCLLNDQAIAAKDLIHRKLVSKILIVDLDVHQGNGTAEIFEGNPKVFTFSMHGASNYPMKKETSDLDIALPDKTGDDLYLYTLMQHLSRLIEEQQPEFVFYQAGVDVLATDKLGRLALSREGCKQRDRYVFEICRLHHIPVMVSMGGGYSRKISDIVEAHCNTFRLALEIFF